MTDTFLQRRDPRFVLFGLDERQTTLRGLGLLAAVFFGSLLIAAVLTPPAYWLVEYWHTQTHSETSQWLLDKGVDVYFDRLRMIAIVLGLPWLMSKCHLWSWRALGLTRRKRDVAAYFLAWLAGVVLIFGLAKVRHARISGYDAIILTHDAPALLKLSFNAVLAGLILGFLEETIFRGMILRLFYTATRRPWLALALMSAFFAYTHFKVPNSVWSHVAPGVHADTGFFVAFWTVCGIAENFNGVEFLVLWLLGMTLGALTLRTGSLFPAIGLHAGIVTAMFFYRGSDLTNNWAAASALAVLLLLITFWRRETRPVSGG